MNHHDMIQNSHQLMEEESLIDNNISIETSVIQHVDTKTIIEEEIIEKVVECKEKIEENGINRAFSSTGSFRNKKCSKKKNLEDSQVSNLNNFLENTEIICTGTNDHCFIIINSNYEENKQLLKNFWITRTNNKLFDINLNNEFLNLGKCINFTETETFDFYDDITLFNSPSYRTKSMDKNSAELIKGKICKIRERNNRRHTGVISLNGFEFFPLDFNVDDDLTETQFYASIRQHILDGKINENDLEKYINIIKKEVYSNVKLSETQTKYSEYLYNLIKKYSKEEDKLINEEIKDITIDVLKKENNVIEESNKSDINNEHIQSNYFDYTNKNESDSDEKHSIKMTEKDNNLLNSSDDNITYSYDTDFRENETLEISTSNSIKESECNSINKYEIIEKTLTLSTETTQSSSPIHQYKENYENKSNDYYEMENNLTTNFSENSSYILNESDLSDMYSDNEKQTNNLNKTKIHEEEKLYQNNESNELYHSSEEIDYNVTTKTIHKTLSNENNIDNDKCLKEETFLSKNNDDYKNVKCTNVYSLDSHSNPIDCKTNIISKVDKDYQLMSSINHSNNSSNMETFKDNKTDFNYSNNQFSTCTPTYNIPLIEKNKINQSVEKVSSNIHFDEKQHHSNIYENLSFDKNNFYNDYNLINQEGTFTSFEDKDKNEQTNMESLSSKINESIENMLSNIIKKAIDESLIKQYNDKLYLDDIEKNYKTDMNKIECHTSVSIIEEDFYTTRVEKIPKIHDDKNVYQKDNDKMIESIDKKVEKDYSKSVIKSSKETNHFDDKNIYYNDNIIYDSNDSNNNTNVNYETKKQKSISCNDLIFHENIKDSDEFLYIDDNKFKIVEKTTVIKEYFKIKDDSDFQINSKEFSKDLDYNNDYTSIHHNSKYTSSSKHERSKSTNWDVSDSNEYSNSDQNSCKVRKYRSSSQSNLKKENYLMNTLYKKKNKMNKDSKSIYRSSGSLTIIDNHTYRKSSEKIMENTTDKNIFDRNKNNVKKFVYNNKELKELESIKFNGYINKDIYSSEESVKINHLQSDKDISQISEKLHDNYLFNTTLRQKNEIDEINSFSLNKQQEQEKNNIFSSNTRMEENINKNINVNTIDKSNDDFLYGFEKDITIKSEEVKEINKHINNDDNSYKVTNNNSYGAKKKDIDESLTDVKYLNEPLFSKIMGNRVETNIIERKIQNIEKNVCHQDKPSAVPVTLENWDYDSCFSDDQSTSAIHELYSKKTTTFEDSSTPHSISSVVSHDKETLKGNKNSYYESQEYKLIKTLENDMNRENNLLEENITKLSQQKMSTSTNEKEKYEEGKLLNTEIITLTKSPELEEQKLVIKDDVCERNLLHSSNNINIKGDKTNLIFNKKNESYSNYTTLKNNHNTNIVDGSVSDSIETSLVDIVKKVKEQNGIYKYNDTKRKTHKYSKETQIIEDSPSQEINKSIYGNLNKTIYSKKNSNNLYIKKLSCSNDSTSSEDFRNSPIFNKIQKSNKNRFKECKRDKFNNSNIEVSSCLSSDFGEPYYHSSFKLSTSHSKINFDKPIPLLSQELYKEMTNNTRDSSPSSISSEQCNQLINVDENSVLHYWNPEKLINQLYKIDYEPRKESKRNHFINMEGHLEVPNTDTNIIPELEKSWKRRYFKTKEGRLTWYATHYADENPEGDILLSGTDIECDKNDGIFFIYGGMEHAKIKVRVPREPEGLFEKWRKALLSHSSSSILDAYVQPVAKKVPHSSEKVVILDLGSCSIRGGLLTKEPSLPQSFFPAIGVLKNDGSVVVGLDALKPENRHNGVLHQPIPNTDPAIEKYKINKTILKACIDKVISDLKIDPTKYKVLLSLPQNVPPTLLGDILKLLLGQGYFNGVSITRQPSLILYSYDVTTGVVIDIGERLNIVPVIDGYIVDNAVINLPYGALQIEDCLRVKLNETNEGFYSFQGPVERMILRYLMEQACYVSNNYEDEVKNCNDNKNVEVSLENFDPTPNMKTKFSINASRFIATEGLFKPSRWGIEGKGLHQLINDAVQLSPIDSRRTLYKNIYLSGGTSLLPNLAERLENEIMKLVPSTIHIQVHTSPWRYHAAYLGAQVLASSCTFDSNCVSNSQLSEFVNQLKNSAF